MMPPTKPPSPIRRIVTGHDSHGNAIVCSDGALPTVRELDILPGFVFHEVWATQSTPALIDNGADPTIGPLVLTPPRDGTRIRFVDFPPETPEFHAQDIHGIEEAWDQIGAAGASTARAGAQHALMHRTESIDYGIVIDGEIVLVLDDEEVEVGPGSVVIQRGTNHAWANRGERPCRMLFILVDGRYEDEIAEALKSR